MLKIFNIFKKPTKTYDVSPDRTVTKAGLVEYVTKQIKRYDNNAAKNGGPATMRLIFWKQVLAGLDFIHQDTILRQRIVNAQQATKEALLKNSDGKPSNLIEAQIQEIDQYIKAINSTTEIK